LLLLFLGFVRRVLSFYDDDDDNDNDNDDNHTYKFLEKLHHNTKECAYNSKYHYLCSWVTIIAK
jgi:hypothetical protein